VDPLGHLQCQLGEVTEISLD